jgi:hypothetical protein
MSDLILGLAFSCPVYFSVWADFSPLQVAWFFVQLLVGVRSLCPQVLPPVFAHPWFFSCAVQYLQLTRSFPVHSPKGPARFLAVVFLRFPTGALPAPVKVSLPRMHSWSPLAGTYSWTSGSQHELLVRRDPLLILAVRRSSVLLRQEKECPWCWFQSTSKDPFFRSRFYFYSCRPSSKPRVLELLSAFLQFCFVLRWFPALLLCSICSERESCCRWSEAVNPAAGLRRSIQASLAVRLCLQFSTFTLLKVASSSSLWRCRPALVLVMFQFLSCSHVWIVAGRCRYSS